MISILLVDDHPLLRKGVAQLIEMEPGLVVVGQASNGQEAIELAHQLDPDMILLDLNMKGLSGIETLTEMRKQNIYSRVVVFTVSDDQEDVIGALRAGADGYLLKDSEPEDLLPAIRQAAEGQQVFSTNLTQIMAMALRDDTSATTADPLEQLTPREIEILKQVALGLANKQIARELDITESTVKVHVKNVLRKLCLRSRVEAALWAVEYKVVKQT